MHMYSRTVSGKCQVDTFGSSSSTDTIQVLVVHICIWIPLIDLLVWFQPTQNYEQIDPFSRVRVQSILQTAICKGLACRNTMSGMQIAMAFSDGLDLIFV